LRIINENGYVVLEALHFFGYVFAVVLQVRVEQQKLNALLCKFITQLFKPRHGITNDWTAVALYQNSNRFLVRESIQFVRGTVPVGLAVCLVGLRPGAIAFSPNFQEGFAAALQYNQQNKNFQYFCCLRNILQPNTPPLR